jgi:hypothetical protein
MSNYIKTAYFVHFPPLFRYNLFNLIGFTSKEMNSPPKLAREKRDWNTPIKPGFATPPSFAQAFSSDGSALLIPSKKRTTSKKVVRFSFPMHRLAYGTGVDSSRTISENTPPTAGPATVKTAKMQIVSKQHAPTTTASTIRIVRIVLFSDLSTAISTSN